MFPHQYSSMASHLVDITDSVEHEHSRRRSDLHGTHAATCRPPRLGIIWQLLQLCQASWCANAGCFKHSPVKSQGCLAPARLWVVVASSHCFSAFESQPISVARFRITLTLDTNVQRPAGMMSLPGLEETTWTLPLPSTHYQPSTAKFILPDPLKQWKDQKAGA